MNPEEPEKSVDSGKNKKEEVDGFIGIFYRMEKLGFTEEDLGYVFLSAVSHLENYFISNRPYNTRNVEHHFKKEFQLVLKAYFSSIKNEVSVGKKPLDVVMKEVRVHHEVFEQVKAGKSIEGSIVDLMTRKNDDYLTLIGTNIIEATREYRAERKTKHGKRQSEEWKLFLEYDRIMERLSDA